MLLSIIIPIYNAEKYLQATVDSILAQNSSDYEVILVNDGSKDGSAELCDSLALRHVQISVVHKPNGGVSSARNVGMEAAKGKYLAFVDSDDKLGLGMIADMLHEIEEKQADKVFCGFEEVYKDGRCISRIANLPARVLLDRNYIISNLLYTGCVTNSYMNSVCGAFYKSQIIHNHNLRFEDRPMGEDWMFNMKYCDLAQSIVYVDLPYYKYLRNSGSAMSRYQPCQFELWLENRVYRKNIANRYLFKIDSKQADADWVPRVLFYALQVIKCDATYKTKLIEIFRNADLQIALRNAYTIKPRYFVPIAWIIKMNWYLLAVSVLKLISKIR